MHHSRKIVKRKKKKAGNAKYAFLTRLICLETTDEKWGLQKMHYSINNFSCHTMMVCMKQNFSLLGGPSNKPNWYKNWVYDKYEMMELIIRRSISVSLRVYVDNKQFYATLNFLFWVKKLDLKQQQQKKLFVNLR